MASGPSNYQGYEEGLHPYQSQRLFEDLGDSMKNILLGGLAIVSAIFSMDCRAAALSNGKSQCDAGVEICTIVIYAFPADLKHTRCYIKAAFEETDASAATKGFSWHLVDAVDDQFNRIFQARREEGNRVKIE